MTGREHELLSRYLDGELPLDALPERLQGDAKEFDRIMSVMSEKRVSAPSGLKPQVMDRVRRLARSPWRRSWVWFMAPHTLTVRPASLGAVLAAAAALFLLALPGGEPAPAATAPAQQAPAPLPPGVVTKFVLLAPAAQTVVVTGDFVDWDPDGVPLARRAETGLWVAELPLPPGVHHYVFVVDGSEWLPDPNATSQVADGFGNHNSVLLVPSAAVME